MSKSILNSHFYCLLDLCPKLFINFNNKFLMQQTRLIFSINHFILAANNAGSVATRVFEITSSYSIRRHSRSSSLYLVYAHTCIFRLHSWIEANIWRAAGMHNTDSFFLSVECFKQNFHIRKRLSILQPVGRRMFTLIVM